jgi:hypothetical protein
VQETWHNKILLVVLEAAHEFLPRMLRHVLRLGNASDGVVSLFRQLEAALVPELLLDGCLNLTQLLLQSLEGNITVSLKNVKIAVTLYLSDSAVGVDKGEDKVLAKTLNGRVVALEDTVPLTSELFTLVVSKQNRDLCVLCVCVCVCCMREICLKYLFALVSGALLHLRFQATSIDFISC